MHDLGARKNYPTGTGIPPRRKHATSIDVTENSLSLSVFAALEMSINGGHEQTAQQQQPVW